MLLSRVNVIKYQCFFVMLNRLYIVCIIWDKQGLDDQGSRITMHLLRVYSLTVVLLLSVSFWSLGFYKKHW